MLADALRGFATGPGPRLFWVDSVDVNTMRAIVQLAKQSESCICVGKSTGSQVVGRVMTSDGWLGATLGEVACRADLIVTVGDSILSEMPLLASRYLETGHVSNRKWFHLGQQVSSAATSLRIPATLLYDDLTRLLGYLGGQPESNLAGSEIARLGPVLKASRYAAILFQVSDFSSHLDEVIVRRLAQIARACTGESRAVLVALDNKPGRITAEETLMWLTGCSGAAVWNGTTWLPPAQQPTQLAEWRQRYASIAVVRTVPADEPLPNIAADLVLLPASELRYLPTVASHYFTVADECFSFPGHLFRGDRAGVFACQSDPEVMLEQNDATSASWAFRLAARGVIETKARTNPPAGGDSNEGAKR